MAWLYINDNEFSTIAHKIEWGLFNMIQRLHSWLKYCGCSHSHRQSDRNTNTKTKTITNENTNTKTNTNTNSNTTIALRVEVLRLLRRSAAVRVVFWHGGPLADVGQLLRLLEHDFHGDDDDE